MPSRSNVMRTSIDARGPSTCDEVVLNCTCLVLDFLSLSLVEGGVVVVEELLLRCGAKALASTRAISSGLQSSCMPSLKRSSSSTNTSSLRRRPSVSAAFSSSSRRVSPIPSALPVLMHRIFRWFWRCGLVRACRVGLKNMDSSSGWAMRSIMRLLRRVDGTGGLDVAVMCHSAKIRTGARTRVRSVDDMVPQRPFRLTRWGSLLGSL